MIDIVLPVWVIDDATIQLTEAAVKSLRATPDVKIIIVDNGSEVGGGKLRELADIYLRNKQNLGYARAVNQGLRLAGDIVAVANNDIRVDINWWPVAFELFNEAEKVGSVHYRMIPYDQSFNPGKDTWLKGKERWCSSSFFVMKNFQQYDEYFLNSYDDWDFWRRFREKGLLTAYTNKAEYQHLDSWTQKKVINRSENDLNNREYYYEKYGEYPDEWMEKTYPEQLKVPWKPFP